MHHPGVDDGPALGERHAGGDLPPALVRVDQNGAEDDEAEQLADVHLAGTCGRGVLGDVDVGHGTAIAADAPAGQQSGDLHCLLVGQQVYAVVGVEVQRPALQRETLEAAGDGAQAVLQISVGNGVAVEHELGEVFQLVLVREGQLHERQLAEGFRL